jgi:hypothetical protein
VRRRNDVNAVLGDEDPRARGSFPSIGELRARERCRIVEKRGPKGCGREVGGHSRASIAAASRSRSMYGSPLTSIATRLMVPPVNSCGCGPG